MSSTGSPRRTRRTAIDRRIAALDAAVTTERQERESQNQADDVEFEAIAVRLAAVENEQVRLGGRLKWLEDRFPGAGGQTRKRRARPKKPAP